MKPDELGTLVLVSDDEDVPQLLQMTFQFTRETFNLPGEELTKFYFSNVPYGFVA